MDFDHNTFTRSHPSNRQSNKIQSTKRFGTDNIIVAEAVKSEESLL